MWNTSNIMIYVSYRCQYMWFRVSSCLLPVQHRIQSWLHLYRGMFVWMVGSLIAARLSKATHVQWLLHPGHLPISQDTDGDLVDLQGNFCSRYSIHYLAAVLLTRKHESWVTGIGTSTGKNRRWLPPSLLCTMIPRWLENDCHSRMKAQIRCSFPPPRNRWNQVYTVFLIWAHWWLDNQQ